MSAHERHRSVVFTQIFFLASTRSGGRVDLKNRGGGKLVLIIIKLTVRFSMHLV